MVVPPAFSAVSKVSAVTGQAATRSDPGAADSVPGGVAAVPDGTVPTVSFGSAFAVPDRVAAATPVAALVPACAPGMLEHPGSASAAPPPTSASALHSR